MAQVEAQDKQAIYYIYNVENSNNESKDRLQGFKADLKIIYNICSIAYNTLIRAYKSFMDAVLLVLVASCFVEPYRAFTNVRMR